MKLYPNRMESSLAWATFTWFTLTFFAAGAGVGAQECRGTYVRLGGDSESLSNGMSCSAPQTPIRGFSGQVHQCTHQLSSESHDRHTGSGVLTLPTAPRPPPLFSIRLSKVVDAS